MNDERRHETRQARPSEVLQTRIGDACAPTTAAVDAAKTGDQATYEKRQLMVYDPDSKRFHSVEVWVLVTKADRQ